MKEYSGIIILNKPIGISSHRCVGIVRRALNMKKVGHTGTLDPDASGVLPILVGTATRAAEFLTAEDKRYRAKVLLGTRTDTLDMSGTVLEKNEVNVTEDEIKNAVKKFVGNISQIPPMYSAIQVNGQRLYTLARQGIDIKREPRDITVFSIDIISIDLPYITIDVHCSKGTYIRTLASDIGDALGCGACISELERTSSGDFTIENSITPEELNVLSEKGEAHKALLPLDSFFKEYDKIYLDKKRADRVKNGVSIFYRGKEQGKFYLLYDENGEFIALSMAAMSQEENGRECLKLIKGFYK
ncbi:MAG: tRNA pseudouridine(55) synthase TruB [Clostridia bacterium]|nr:tRNA pseudouridine(55) synthase TruB [Clostridia bacterium]